MLNEKMNEMLKDIPTYSRFLYLWEIDRLMEDIRKNRLIKTEVIGKTKTGEDMELFSIGTGNHTALLLGVPHSDEPLGSLVSLFLLQWLASHPEADCFGWRFLIVTVVERDG